MSVDWRRRAILAGLVLAYFVAFPGDLRSVLEPAREVLSLTQAVSPWFYVVVATAILARALVSGFSRKVEG
jgi:hypothetical protein